MASDESEKHARYLRLYIEHEEALMGFLRTLVPGREEAREVLQEVAVVLWRKFDELKTGEGFRPWAFTVARFKALAWIRDRKRERLVFDEDVLALLADELEERHDAYEAERRALEECLDRLEPAQRKLLDAAYAPGARIDVLAEEAGRSAMAFYKTLHRIRVVLLGCTEKVLAREGLV